MQCDFKVKQATIEETIKYAYSIVNPILYEDIKHTKINKILYKNISGLYVGIARFILHYTNQNKHALRIKLLLSIYKNKTNRLVRVVNLVIGKNTASKAKLGEALVKLNDLGRASGIWRMSVLLDESYGDLDLKDVVRLYINTLKDYPGVVEFVTTDDEVFETLKKIIKHTRVT